jgi:hypothetical protein
MKKLAELLGNLGVERRFALDIGSVIYGVRPRGLLHVSADLQYGLEHLLNSLGLRIEASRELCREHDSTSREGILNDYSSDPAAEKWCEVWYSNADAAPVDQATLFSNPGKFLGYPECCRRSLEGKDALARLYRRYLFEDSDRHWEINRLAALFHDAILMPDFFPCSMSCASARSYVIPFHDVALRVLSKREIEEAKKAMCAPITIIAGEIVQWRDWNSDNGRLRVKVGSAKKEAISRVSPYLPSSEPSTALLVGFKHLLDLEKKALPRVLSIEVDGRDMMELSLKLV